MLTTIFSRLTLRLLPACLLLCAVVPVFGARQLPRSEAWEQFGFDYCKLPCFAGITPGVTPFNGIAQLLLWHIPVIDPSLIASGSAINFWARLPTQQLGGLMRYERGTVGEMRFNGSLPVGEMVAELGSPDCILPNTQGDPDRLTVIFWERSGVSIGALIAPDQRTINLNADALALWLRAIAPGDDCSLWGALPWRGFAPLWRYTG